MMTVENWQIIKKINIDVDYTEILITTGGSEAINFAFLSTMDVGDELIVPEPFMQITTVLPPQLVFMSFPINYCIQKWIFTATD